MNLKNLKITFIFALMSLATVPMNGQDLLARQAPVDKKMKRVDSVALHQLIHQEMLDNPAADLYDEWDTEMTHYHNANAVLPETATIDLRGFVMPTPSRVITSNFGARWGRQHKGLDIKVYVGDTIRAAFSGKVRIVKYEARGYGKYVVIRHYNGLETYYAHMSKQLVREDQEVKAGDPIGLGGNTGRSTGSHLHFETRLCGVAINPALLFDFRAQDVTGDSYLFRKRNMESESARATRERGQKVTGGYTHEEVTGKKEPARATASATESKSSTRYHKVEQGETIYSIARKYGITVETLAKMNHIGDNMRVRVGQLLRYS